MNFEEIIEMAREARLHRNQHNLASNPVQYRFSYDGTEEALIAFAKLVAAKEREACAKYVEGLTVGGTPLTVVMGAIGDAIRARGEA